MSIFNLSYETQDLSELQSTLQSYGTVLFTLENLKVIVISTEHTKETISSVNGVIEVETDAELIIEPHTLPWHLRRLVTRQLPLRDDYLPLSDGENVTVYVVDSGIDSSHSEFLNSTVVHLYSEDNDFSDSTGHGTAIASLINGATVGVSKAATVKSVKIPLGVATTISKLLLAFDAVLSDHLLTNTVKVVNCSWTVPKSQLLDAKITELQSHGLVVVAAAGNTAENANNFSPVGLNSVLGVGASDSYDRVINWSLNVGSNWGTEVDLTAPGINVLVADTQTQGLSESSGTSISAAIVSGVVAQFIASYTDKTAVEIQQLVLNHASEDALFRNESIYGTTPNRLAMAFFLSPAQIFTTPFYTMFPAKIGETTNVVMNVISSEIVSVVHEQTELPMLNQSYTPWSWVSVSALENNTFTLSITPTNAFQAQKYGVWLKAIDNAGGVYKGYYVIGVYNNSVTELDVYDYEVYQSTSGNETVTVVAAIGCSSACTCPKGSTCVYPCAYCADS